MTVSYEPLFYWVREREAIRRLKESGAPFPWTVDPILREWRFCNVRREDDRVTRWIDENLRRPFEGHPHLWFMLCAARQLNWPPTIEHLMTGSGWPDHPDFTPEGMGLALETRAARGDKVFTGAYIVTAPATKGEKKTTFVAEKTLGRLWQDREVLWRIFADDRTSLRHAHSRLVAYPGWGPFLAYQAVVDLRFCPDLLGTARDVSTWAAAGPGTLRGLNRLHGRPLDEPLSQERALTEMLPLYELIPRETGVEIDLSDVPNCLCEVDKYLRVKTGGGTPRARYVPGRGS